MLDVNQHHYYWVLKVLSEYQELSIQSFENSKDSLLKIDSFGVRQEEVYNQSNCAI